jgi:hypothetical protein
MSEFLVQSVFAVKGNVVLVGKVTQGEIRNDMKTVIIGKQCHVLDIESSGKHPPSVTVRDNATIPIGITVSGVLPEDFQKENVSKIEFE